MSKEKRWRLKKATTQHVGYLRLTKDLKIDCQRQHPKSIGFATLFGDIFGEGFGLCSI